MLPREEREVMESMVDLVLENCKSTTRVTSHEELAHWFGVACHRCKFLADHESYKRIVAEVSYRISELARVAGQVATATRKRR